MYWVRGHKRKRSLAYLGVQEKLGIMQRGLVYALYDYSAEQADELSVGEGEAVVVLRRGDDHEGPEWWTCTHVNTSPGGTQRDERQGYLPRNIMGVRNFIQ